MQLEKHGLLDWLSSRNLICIGTDGAAFLLGTEHGLIKKVRSNLSHLIGVHCAAHRPNLSVLSAVENGKFIDYVDSTLKKLYQFYQYSPKRLQQLKQVAESLQTSILKFQYLHNVRWVASIVGALSALVKDWKCVTVHLESLAAEKDSASAVAKGLLQKLIDFKFIHMLHFLLYYLGILKNLSLLYQREQLFVSTIKLHVKNTVTLLESLKCNPCQNEGRFFTNTTVQGIYQDVHLHGLNNTARSSIESEKENMIMHGVKCLEERFWNQGVIERSTTIFDTFVWPTGSAPEDYGVNEVVALAEHFKKTNFTDKKE
jgi:hypothetical protein